MSYKPLEGRSDTSLSSDGEIKPEWGYVLDSLSELGSETLQDRRQKMQRILRDDGATYNIYEEQDSPSGDWELDLVPSIIGSEEWAVIEAGLLERSELFNLILKDLYGPRTLLRHRAFPPEALYSHGGFLRACDGVRLPGDHDLIIHAVDMIRRDDGTMCVLSDRTQAPSGSGYALENRTVMSRVFPTLFRDSHVHRLAGYYQSLRQKLTSLSPSDGVPRVVVLTPGAFNETYFEHAYLANYLGFPLVQSGDLLVRNGFLWMKSLDGLERVDVVLRRVDDVFCDPVELRSDSQLGVPGLLEVVRSGRVVIANPLGAGILENPVFLKYLPEISRCLLGRELRLDSVKTYWSGDEKDLTFITENIDRLVIKPAYRGTGLRSVWGGDLSKEGKKSLLARIKASPYQYVAQERLDKSLIPTFDGSQLSPRPAILRSFSVAADHSYRVMPGGLTRVGLSPDSHIISMQGGCPSKDTWVTATEPERLQDVAAGADAAIVPVETQLISLPSRVVENLFWMGRYAERAESSLRILRTAFIMLNGEEPVSDKAKRILLKAVTEITATQPGFSAADESLFEKPDRELLQIISDGNRIGSIRSTLNSMLFCADESREMLSADTIQVINDIRESLGNLDRALAGGLTSAPEEALDPFVSSLLALSGLMQESMVRGVGWRFLEMGKRLERSMQVIGSIRSLVCVVTEGQDQKNLLMSLLMSMEILITYRRHYRSQLMVEQSLTLVMLEDANPRSLLFQLEQLQLHFSKLPKPDSQSRLLPEEERALLEAVTTLKLARLDQLIDSAGDSRENLLKLLDELEKLLSEFSNILSDKYFDHRVDSRQLVTTFWGN